jgi:hypothetical protein
MSWIKYFAKVSVPNQRVVDIGGKKDSATAGSSAKYSSYLPEVYAGHPNRIQRYYQYDDMDRDSDIHSALDTIADFCTQSEEQNDNPFEISYYGDDATETEVKIIKAAMTKWTRLNNFRSRLWQIFRETIKNGDQFFLRDPETGEWLWVDHFSVEMVKVDDTTGKEPDEYIIRGLDYNKQAKFATGAADPLQYRTPLGTSNVGGSRPVGSGNSSTFSLAGQHSDPRMRQGAMGTQDQLFVVDAQHVVHLSLSSGMDINWPFGQSVLEAIFKVFKQKELLEDAIIIYRVQRAPERRIFYIDTGSMPPNRAKAHIEQIKNEIHQRRIPNRTGGGACIDLSTRIPLLDGRTLTLRDMITEHENGSQNWVYSCDPVTGAIVPGKVTWAGVTRKNTKVLKIVLDNGEEVTCTPDHKIPVWEKGFVEAQNLTMDDSLFSFRSRLHTINKRTENIETEPQYTQVFDHKEKKWVYAHRMVASFMKERELHAEMFHDIDRNKKTVIHHRDFNKYNNNPENLAYMILVNTVQSISSNEKVVIDALTHNDRFMSVYRSMNETQSGMISKLNLDVFCRDSLSKLLKTNGYEKWSTFVKSLGLVDNMKPSRTLRFPRVLMNKVVDTVKAQKSATIPATIAALNQDEEFISAFITINSSYKGNKANEISFSQSTLKTVLEKNNYKNFNDFKSKVSEFNHRIVSITVLEEAIDVGTITVDGNEELHDFHTFAIEQGIFIKNSVLDAAYNPLAVMDDYFFAQGVDGRGSKVETLPGGELVGEIGDLLFFSKKLARGLRIPPLYLFGDDANAMAFNDGKLGTALVQEFLFNKYCMRLQAMLAKTFDYEFKYYLRKTGIEIDENMFELRFCTPQNFAKYRQIELDSQQMQVFSQIKDDPTFSKRFIQRRFLNLNEDEILENEKMWREENPDKIKKKTGSDSVADEQPGLSSVGVRSGAMFPDTGLDAEPDSFAPDEGGAEGGEAPPDGGAPPPAPPVSTGGAPAQ